MLKFNVHTSGLDSLGEKVSSASDKAAHIVAVQVRKDTSPYVPALTGDLDRRTRVDGSRVIYPGPQSRYLYHGKLMVDPATGSSYAQKGSTKVLTDKNLVFSKAMARTGTIPLVRGQQGRKHREVGPCGGQGGEA